MSLLPDPTPALPEQRGGSKRFVRGAGGARIMMSLLPDPTPALPEQRGGSELVLRTMDVRGLMSSLIPQNMLTCCVRKSP